MPLALILDKLSISPFNTNGLAYGPPPRDLFVSSRSRPLFASDPAGTWTEADEPDLGLSNKQVTYSPLLDRFVLIGSEPGAGGIEGGWADGSDPATWTRITGLSGVQPTINAVAWSENLGIFCCTRATFGQSWTSPTGESNDWTQHEHNTIAVPGIRMRRFDDVGLFMVPWNANPPNGTIHISSAGTTWSAIVMPDPGMSSPNVTWRGIAYSPTLDLLVAAGEGPSGSEPIPFPLAISSDGGMTWQLIAAPDPGPFHQGFTNVAWVDHPTIGGFFVALARATFEEEGENTDIITHAYSPDGFNWTRFVEATGTGVGAFNDTFGAYDDAIWIGSPQIPAIYAPRPLIDDQNIWRMQFTGTLGEVSLAPPRMFELVHPTEGWETEGS